MASPILPITRLVLAWTVGIALARALELSGWGAAAMLAVALALLAASRIRPDHPRRRSAAVALLAFTLGAARLVASREVIGQDHIAARNDQGPITLRGRIVEEPDRRDKGTQYRVAVEADGPGGGPARGLVLVQAPSYPPLAYGDLVELEGEPTTPPVLEGFDYRAYLERQGIHSLMRRPRMRRRAGGGSAWRRGLIALRDRGRRSLAAALPEPEAALVTGILLGDDRGLPAPLAEAFKATNTTHIIAISGSNIALLVGFLGLTLGRLLGMRRALPVILMVLAAYSLLVGGDAAVVRAALMGSLGLLALRLGRAADAQAGLMAAAWLMSAWDPVVLWDLGFQLSFAATLGLIRYAGLFAARVEAGLAARLPAGQAARLTGWASEMLLVTLAAQLTTWPIIAHQTGQVSRVGLLANALILPAQPWVMGLGALALGGGMLWAPLGRLLGLAAWLPTAYTVAVVDWLGNVPGASATWPMPAWALVLWYLGLGLISWPGAKRALAKLASLLRATRPDHPFRDDVTPEPPEILIEILPPEGADRSGQTTAGTAIVVHRPSPPAPTPEPPRWHRLAEPIARLAAGFVPLAAALALAVFGWTAAHSRPDGLLHVHLLDVGQGDALLVVSPNGRRLLIDGGPSPSALLAELGRRMAPWDRRLDLVLLTHPDADHVGGLLPVLRRFEIGGIVDPQLESEAPEAAAWSAALAEPDARGVPRHHASAGGGITLDERSGVHADILWPPEPRLEGVESATNENAVVLRLTYGATTALFTGDIGFPAEDALLARLAEPGSGLRLDAQVLKVGHHGSRGSSGPGFLAAVRPQVALIGVGADNRYGHPAPEVMERLGGAIVRRTDLDGAAEVISDGERWWVR